MKPTARIDKTLEDGKVCLWLIINGDNDTAHPILKNEVEAIMLACQEYLRENKND